MPDCEFRMGDQYLIGIAFGFIHAPQQRVACRQHPIGIRLVMHLVQSSDRLFVITHIEIGFAQMPEIPVRIERIEMHCTVNEFYRPVRIAKDAGGMSHFRKYVRIIRIVLNGAFIGCQRIIVPPLVQTRITQCRISPRVIGIEPVLVFPAVVGLMTFLSFFIGIFLQLMWEDLPITEPL